MASFGHSGSHAPQLMHSSVMWVAMGLPVCRASLGKRPRGSSKAACVGAGRAGAGLTDEFGDPAAERGERGELAERVGVGRPGVHRGEDTLVAGDAAEQ